MTKFEDDRGMIEDLKVTDTGAVTYITFKKGAIRGNHYHKETVQSDFILSGRFLCRTDKGTAEVKAGQAIFHKPNEPHAYLAIEDGEMVSCVYGPRKGEDYSKDTFKLETPLL